MSDVVQQQQLGFVLVREEQHVQAAWALGELFAVLDRVEPHEFADQQPVGCLVGHDQDGPALVLLHQPGEGRRSPLEHVLAGLAVLGDAGAQGGLKGVPCCVDASRPEHGAVFFPYRHHRAVYRWRGEVQLREEIQKGQSRAADRERVFHACDRKVRRIQEGQNSFGRAKLLPIPLFGFASLIDLPGKRLVILNRKVEGCQQLRLVRVGSARAS
jgi:hypothetical protein